MGAPLHRTRTVGAKKEALIHWLMVPDAPASRSSSRTSCNVPSGSSDAACRGHGVRTWFSGAEETVDKARAVGARRVPVREDCLEFAMADLDLEGMWAGLTAMERRQMRRARVA